jgi:hypothetical protein
MDDLEIIFDKPAAEWNEALPLGNGTMGAMSYGRLLSPFTACNSRNNGIII